LGGDFNGRIGERGARNREEERGMGKCRGEETDGRMDRRKWTGGNVNKQGDKEGEWSYLDSRGETMIDYKIVNEEVWESVEELRIGERAEAEAKGRERTEKERCEGYR
jgi:hypothetical protein